MAIIGSLIISCNKKEEAAPAEKEGFCLSEKLKEKMQIEDVKKQGVQENIGLTGNITYNADNVVKFSSLVEGIVTKTFFSLGDHVKKGQVLAEIRSTELNNLEAQAKTLQSQLQVAQRQLQSVKGLSDDGIASQKDLLQAQSEVDVLNASIANVNANLSLFSASNDKSVFLIKAPTEGYIVDKNISPGTQISQNSEPLFTISNLKEVWVLANIYTTNVTHIKEGMPVDIVLPAYPGEIFKGKITTLSQVFDADEHVLKARVVMENKDLKLKPGMPADIIINKGENDRELPAVPASAVLFDDNKNYILVYKDDCNIEVREINPAIKNSRWAYFENEVKEGEKIITRNQLLILEKLKG
jgi:cobalt-zinc-cadmium efflux system membrane fusion protein